MHMNRTHPRFMLVDWRRLSATILALLALILASVGWFAYTELARTEPLVVAARDVPPGTRLTAADLSIVLAPVVRPAALQGVTEPSSLIGQYVRIALTHDQIVQPTFVQTQPLTTHIYVNDPLPAEAVIGVVFPLPRGQIDGITSQDRVNIIVLVDQAHGNDPTVQVAVEDTAAGHGPRAVRVLRDLNIVHVTDDTLYLDVTPAQSQYLLSLRAATMPLVPEVALTPGAPLGPMQMQAVALPQIDQPVLHEAEVLP